MGSLARAGITSRKRWLISALSVRMRQVIKVIDYKKTAHAFGYADCEELTDLVVVWQAYAGDGEMVYEVWRHLVACPQCAENRWAVQNWREWKS